MTQGHFKNMWWIPLHLVPWLQAKIPQLIPQLLGKNCKKFPSTQWYEQIQRILQGGCMPTCKLSLLTIKKIVSSLTSVRSLPELSLLKETSIGGLTLSTPKLNSISENAVCSSWDGELIIVNGDQEMFVVSVLHQKKIYRHLDSVSQVYKKDLTAAQGVISAPAIHKEKQKGIFSSVIKDMTRSKAKPVLEEDAQGARENIEELSTIFSVDNFPSSAESRAYLAMDENEVDLDIGIPFLHMYCIGQ